MSEQNALQQTIQLDLPASLQYLNVLGACLEAVLTRVPHVQELEITSYHLQLAVQEICANMVLHAYACEPEQGRIEVVIALSPHNDCLTINLVDTGQPFDEESVKEPSLEEGQIHGYGLFLVRNLMDSVDYQRQGGRNCWSLKKYLLPSEATDLG